MIRRSKFALIPLLLFPLCLFAGSPCVIDLASPQATLATYLCGLAHRNKAVVAGCFEPPADDFYLPEAFEVESYEIKKTVVYGPKQVKRWNDAEIVPAARQGDVELTVVQRYRGQKSRYSYLVREFSGEWKIVADAEYGAP